MPGYKAALETTLSEYVPIWEQKKCQANINCTKPCESSMYGEESFSQEHKHWEIVYQNLLYHKTALAQINTFNYYAIPPVFIIGVPTIFAWDTDDSTEETRPGKRTAHITGGTIIQREQSITSELRR